MAGPAPSHTPNKSITLPLHHRPIVDALQVTPTGQSASIAPNDPSPHDLSTAVMNLFNSDTMLAKLSQAILKLQDQDDLNLYIRSLTRSGQKKLREEKNANGGKHFDGEASTLTPADCEQKAAAKWSAELIRRFAANDNSINGYRQKMVDLQDSYEDEDEVTIKDQNDYLQYKLIILEQVEEHIRMCLNFHERAQEAWNSPLVRNNHFVQLDRDAQSLEIFGADMVILLDTQFESHLKNLESGAQQAYIELYRERQEVIDAMSEGIPAQALLNRYHMSRPRYSQPDPPIRERLDKAAQHAVKFYQSHGPGNVYWCPVLRGWFDGSQMVGAHILPHSEMGEHLSYLFGTNTSDHDHTHSIRNYLYINRQVELRFDQGRITIMPIDVEQSFSEEPNSALPDRFRVHIIDPTLLKEEENLIQWKEADFIKEANHDQSKRHARWTDVAADPELIFLNDNRPSKRYLFWHSLECLKTARAKMWDEWELYEQAIGNQKCWATPGKWIRNSSFCLWAAESRLNLNVLMRSPFTFDGNINRPNSERQTELYRIKLAAQELGRRRGNEARIAYQIRPEASEIQMFESLQENTQDRLELQQGLQPTPANQLIPLASPGALLTPGIQTRTAKGKGIASRSAAPTFDDNSSPTPSFRPSQSIKGKTSFQRFADESPDEERSSPPDIQVNKTRQSARDERTTDGSPTKKQRVNSAGKWAADGFRRVSNRLFQPHSPPNSGSGSVQGSAPAPSSSSPPPPRQDPDDTPFASGSLVRRQLKRLRVRSGDLFKSKK